MPNVIYVGTKVNSSANELTTVSGRFQPVSTSVKTQTGVMVGCKGFDLVGSGSSDVYSSIIDNCEKQVAGIIGDVRRTQAKILEFSETPQSDIDDFVDSLSTQEYYALKESGALKGFDKKISGLKKAGFAAKNLFTGACTFALGFMEGAADFVENLGDGAVMLVGSTVSGVADLVGADEFANKVDSATRAYVAQDLTGNAFDAFYADTAAGQYLQNNCTFFDEARGFGEGIGYSTAVITAAAVFPGGMIGAAAASGFGAAAEKSTADGASRGEALLYSTASAGWEAAQWAIGAKIGGVKIKGASNLKNAAVRIGLDAADSGVEGFVQPALTMLYKDYGGDSFAENYSAAFEANGGWNTVWTQAAVGAAMSGANEAKDAFKTKFGGKGKKGDAGDSKPTGDEGKTIPDDGDVKALPEGDSSTPVTEGGKAGTEGAASTPTGDTTAKPGDSGKASTDAEGTLKGDGTKPADTGTPTTGDGTKPAADTGTPTGDGNTKPGDTNTKPADVNAKPAEASANPGDSAKAASDAGGTLKGDGTKPADVNAKPTETGPVQPDTNVKPTDTSPVQPDTNVKPTETGPVQPDTNVKPTETRATQPDTKCPPASR